MNCASHSAMETWLIFSVCCCSHLWVHLDLSPFSAPTTCVGFGSWEVHRERVIAPCTWRWCDDMSAYTTVVGGEVRYALQATRSPFLLCDTCQTWDNFSSEERTRYSQWRHSQCQFSSVQFSCSVVSNSLRPHETQHTRPPCPSPTPGVHLNSCPSSQWCHPAIFSSVVPFSSCPQSLPASGSFQMSQLFAWGGQSIGVSASAPVLPMNTQGWSPSEWTGWISLQSKGLSRVFSNTTVQKHQFFGAQPSSQSNSQIHTWPLEKP